MVKKKVVSVLDIGSAKLTVLTAGEGSNKNIVVYGRSDVEYSGFSDGELFEPEKFGEKLGKAIENVELTSNIAIKELTVGVPAEFCYNTTRKINLTFAKKLKLTPSALKEIYEMGVDGDEESIPISVEPIYNILDDGKKVIDVVGLKTSKLTAFVSVVFAKKDFIQLINENLAKLGVVSVKYVCSALAETQYLLGDLPSEAMLIDVGYLTTSIAVAKGRGLVNLFSFSQGGAHIMADLAECLELSLTEAEDLKNKIILTLQPSANDCYEVSSGAKERKIFVKVANEIVVSRLEYIAKLISICLQRCDIEEYFPVYLTGGGITAIKGAKDIIANSMGRTVGIISPTIVEFNKPYCSSIISLVQNAIKNI
ncbi:MAG: hypothetical protein IKT27_00110 [Clostridia bacterium]|nr:hypothetical protein [Clostridia bacterium]